MRIMIKMSLFLLLSTRLLALETADQTAINNIVERYIDSWNNHEGKGFGDDFTDDADFVNIFGMYMKGKALIEERHVKILTTFYKGSVLEILDTQLREIAPNVVVGIINWRLNGFRAPGSDPSTPGVVKEGVFTQVFLNSGKKWEITASQNTMKAKP